MPCKFILFINSYTLQILITLNLISVWIHATWLMVLQGIFAVMTLCLFWKRTNKATRTISIVFILIGIFIFLKTASPLSAAVIAFTKTVNYLAFSIFIQVIGLPVAAGGYMDIIKFITQKRSYFEIFTGSAIFVYTIACFLLIGAIPVSYNILEPILLSYSGKLLTTTLNKIIMRSFCLAIIWSPLSLSASLAAQLTGININEMFVVAIPISAIILFANILYNRSKYTNEHIKNESQNYCNKKQLYKRVFELIFALCITCNLIVKLSSFEFFQRATVLYTVIMVCFLVTFIWSMYLKCFNEVISSAIDFFCIEVPKKFVNQSVIFVSLGFFMTFIERTELIESLFKISNNLWDSNSPLILILIPLLIVLFSNIGIHPFASMTLIGTEIIKYNMGISLNWIATSLSLGSALALIVSPFVGPVLLFSGLSGKDPYQSGLKGNFLFALSSIAIFYIVYMLWKNIFVYHSLSFFH